MGESGPVIITRFFTKCAIISQPLAPYLYEFFGMVYLTMTALLGGGLAGALVLIPLLYVGVPVSGAHLNPAVTLVSYLIFPERLSFLNSFYYILCQLVGAFTGAALGWLILDSTYAPVIDHFGRAFVTEVGFTSLLLVTALAAFSGHEKQCSIYGVAAISSIVAASFICNAAISGSMLNPALGLALVLVNYLDVNDVSALKPLSIYLTAPFLAVIIAVGLFLISGYYPLIHQKRDDIESNLQYDRLTG